MPLAFVKKPFAAVVATKKEEPVFTSEPPLPEAWETLKGQPVGDSADLRRILALPRRERPSDAELHALAADFKRRFGKGNVRCECLSKYKRPCCADLKPIQAWALHEIETVGGLLGPIGVGHGKTLLDMLAPMVAYEAFGARRVVLLLPPNLKRQFLEVDWHYYGQHWNLPNLAEGRFYTPDRPFLFVIAFSELSGAKSTELLSGLNLDALVVDEAHSVRNRSAARTKRFLRLFKDKPNTRLFCWSGTLTSRSLRDYGHLSAFALRDGSPVPLHWPALEAWAGALDASDLPTPAGRLLSLGENGDARDRFQGRLVSTPGVVSSGDAASCQASLIISERKVHVPAQVAVALDQLEETWQRPDGDELVDALSKARCARELSSGFYNRWTWPRGEKVAVIEAWLEARKNWHKELREKLKKGGAHMDSPLLCTRAAIRWYEGYTHVKRDADGRELGRTQIPPFQRNGPLPTWEAEHWPRWREVRETAQPETEAVWLDDFLVKDALEWLKLGPGLLWYEFVPFAERLLVSARAIGAPVTFAGPGKSGDGVVLGLRGDERVVASSRAHGTGKNLQMFARNLFANPQSDGAGWEQNLGRTHRAGQLADEVTVEVYRHTEAFASAVEKARDLSEYIEGTLGTTQRLASVATWGF